MRMLTIVPRRECPALTSIAGQKKPGAPLRVSPDARRWLRYLFRSDSGARLLERLAPLRRPRLLPPVAEAPRARGPLELPGARDARISAPPQQAPPQGAEVRDPERRHNRPGREPSHARGGPPRHRRALGVGGGEE